MNKISALIHTQNDEGTLGRTLETLRVADEVVVVDHGSTDGTLKVARQYGARVVPAVAGVERGAYAIDCAHDWILCLQPDEGIGEALEAALLEWKQTLCNGPACNLAIRAENDRGWQPLPSEARLANRKRINWKDASPGQVNDAQQLTGHLWRFR